METMKFAERLKYLAIPKSSHSVRPMALQRRSFASIYKRLKGIDWLLARDSVLD